MKLPTLYIPGCPHSPTLIQRVALGLPRKRELLYGGAAGGGKTDFLLMAALQYIDVAGYSAIIFRRTFKQLAAPEDGLMARAMQWLGGHPDFEGRDPISGLFTRWRYKGGGSLIFSHLQHEHDKYDHQGPSYQFIGWDELTQFSQSQYTYLISRLRRLKSSAIHLRVRSASNPGGAGHDWVRERFPIPDHGNRRPIVGRAFVPAKLSDNPHLDQDDYVKQLSELHPYERAQLLEGDWDARAPGSLFKREWFEIVDAAPPVTHNRLRYWDLAATEAKNGKDPDWTVGSLFDEKDDDTFLCDVVRLRGTPDTIDKAILATANADGAATRIWIEEEGGASGKWSSQHFRKLLRGFDSHYHRPTGSKPMRAKPMASAAQGGSFKLVAGPWIPAWITELEMFAPDCAHDDQVDSASGGFGKLTLERRSTWGSLGYGNRDADGARVQ